MARRIYLTAAALAALVIIYQAVTVGYGQADQIAYHAQQSAQASALPSDERLTVVYERMIGSDADLLHLRIDTTYHARGKGVYQHEIVGKRHYSLRSFDGAYTDMSDAAAACFVMDGREWEAAQEHGRRIMDYDCKCMQVTLDGVPYRTWYAEALPHLHPEARAVDGYRRLILEVRDAEGNYSLQAKYIEHKIG